MLPPQSPHAPHTLPALAVIVCGAMWGLFWLPLRWFEATGVSAAWLSAVFSATAMVVCLPWLAQREAWRGWDSQAITGLLLGTGFTFYTISLALTDVLHAILLFYLTPVWSTLAGWLWRSERLSPQRLAAIALGFGGVFFILGEGVSVPVPRNSGDWLALASGMLWSAGTLRAFGGQAQRISAAVFWFGWGGLVSTIAILVLVSALQLPLAQAGALATQWPWIVALALIIFVPPNALVLWASQRLDPGRVGILLMTEVMVGAISAALLSGEDFGTGDAIGTALIIAAGFTEVLGRR